MGNFITIQTERFRKSTIKRYRPEGAKNLILYFNVSRDKIICQTFTFEIYQDREQILRKLDNEL